MLIFPPKTKLKVLQTTTLILLGLLSHPLLVFKRRFTISESKSKFIFSSRERRFENAELKLGLANHYAIDAERIAINLKH